MYGEKVIECGREVKHEVKGFNYIEFELYVYRDAAFASYVLRDLVKSVRQWALGIRRIEERSMAIEARWWIYILMVPDLNW